MSASRLTFSTLLSIIGLTLAAASFAAHADALQDASRLLKQGQPSQALEQADRYLAGKPKDAQGRFLRGIALAEMGRSNDAIAVFTKLTEEYPELPEPYNNLAVIYAQQRQYDKARQALEMAIRTHPSYATAHENLGDIYARLASQAYDKALQIDSSNSAAQNKLSMIRDLISLNNKTGGVTRPTVEIKPARPVAPPPVEAPPAQTPPPAAEPSKAQGKAAPTGSDAATTADVAKAVEAWAGAWSKKDVKTYLARYARDFKTPGNQSRSAWENERSQRINKPGKIDVTIENVRVTADGADRVVVKFRQFYKSASLKTSSSKVLVMVKRDGKWLIQQERVGG